MARALSKVMQKAANELDFELAALIRDKLKEFGEEN
jgi:excinuclease UvrABC nuclease subunit